MFWLIKAENIIISCQWKRSIFCVYDG